MGSLRAMITHDDDRPPASKAFMHARMLALDRGAVPVFLAVLRRALRSPPELCAAISALQALCANDDVCKQVRGDSPAPRLCAPLWGFRSRSERTVSPRNVGSSSVFFIRATFMRIVALCHRSACIFYVSRYSR